MHLTSCGPFAFLSMIRNLMKEISQRAPRGISERDILTGGAIQSRHESYSQRSSNVRLSPGSTALTLVASRDVRIRRGVAWCFLVLAALRSLPATARSDGCDKCCIP